MSVLFSHIGLLAGIQAPSQALRGPQLAALPCIKDAFLITEGDRIAGFGPMSELAFKPSDFTEEVNARGRMLLPAWCDSHTHLVFAGSREGEFEDKIRGLDYAAIAAKGGGILNSARRVNEASEAALFNESLPRLQEVMGLGTGAIEIKSGYGLSLEGELKMLRVIRRLKETSRIPVKATFLGAHAFPEAYRDDREGYIQLIIDEMLPRVAGEKLADYIDVFCEKGFYTPEETEKICLAGKELGLTPKIHANQLHVSKGVETGVKVGALSVDHLESMDEDAINALAGSSTIGTLLPSAAFFLRMPYQPARTLIDQHCAVALASDYNPGSSPSGNMHFVVSLACIQLRMLPEEAINAATINGAFAMGLGEETGSIAIGKQASLQLTQPIPSLAFLPYAFGKPQLDRVMVRGEWV
jgi:imidazolonepropionase